MSQEPVVMMVHADHRNGCLTDSGFAQARNAVADLVVCAAGKRIVVVTTADDSSTATVENLARFVTFQRVPYDEQLEGRPTCGDVDRFVDFVLDKDGPDALLVIVGPGVCMEEMAVKYAKRAYHINVRKPRLGHGQRVQLDAENEQWVYLD